jgi:hypothetical protein
MITIATGMPGVGKSKETEDQLNVYVQVDSSVNRAGRKVLIFDTNDEYRKYRSVAYNARDPKDNGRYFADLRNIEIRRVLPYWASPNGAQNNMSFEDKEKTLVDIVNNYRNGLVLLEDINTYLVSVKSVETISALCAARHKGMDIIIHLQSLSAVDTRMWQNASYIRMHYQTDDIVRYKGRLNENFEPLKIAQNIVNTEYMGGNIYYFIYFNNKTKKLSGCTREQYLNALDMYRAEQKQGFMLTKNPFMYFQE